MVKGSPISTYQKNYKSRYPAFTPVYEKNVDYRVDRRRLEHNHATGPFTWDDEWETSSEELNGHNGQISKRPHSLPPHKYKHDKFNKAYQEKMNNQTFVFQNRNGISVFAPAKNTLSKTKEVKVKARCYKDDFAQTVSMEDVAVQTEMNDRRKERTNKATAEETLERAPTADKQTSTNDRPVPGGSSSAKASLRPRKPAQQLPARSPVPRPRPFPSPLGRPLSSAGLAEEKAPFVPYGCCDQEKEAGAKKTHNVRASAEVYPSALRAMKRRQTSIEKREQLSRSASLREHRKQALFNDFNEKMRRDTSQWATEYRSHYCGHDRTEYAKNLAERLTPGKTGLAATL